MIRALLYAAAAAVIGAIVANIACAHDAFPVGVDCKGKRCTFGYTAEGREYDCGRIRIQKNKTTGQKWAMIRVPCRDVGPMPSPIPTRSPRPTNQASLCVTNPAGYCWAKGARLNGNTCWASCNCIPRQLGECEK